MTPSDRELIEWLATNVMGWHKVIYTLQPGGWYWSATDDGRAVASFRWNPLASHDDAAMLEAKVRERGDAVEQDYARALMKSRKESGFTSNAMGPTFSIMAARRAKPRQICEAIKAAWENDRPS